MSFDQETLAKIRADFPILAEKFNDLPVAYLDNGATSQRPLPVLNALIDFYHTQNANVHRGIHFLADRADGLYLEARRKVQKFLNAEYVQEIVFTRNATESLNLVAFTYGRANLQRGDEVLLTQMEHHSNIVPWQMLAAEKGLSLKFVKVNDEGELDMDDFVAKLSEKTKLVSVVHVSNTLGVTNPVEDIVEKAHEIGAKVILDACQSAPHMQLDVQALGCDFLAFSAHKMCGPMGVGVLYGKRELLEAMPAFLGGGGMIGEVTEDGYTLADLPEKYDAGTPNVQGAIGLGAAIDYLDGLGWENIHQHERKLTDYMMGRVNDLNFVRVIGPKDVSNRLGILSFEIDGVHPHDIAEFFNSKAICIRAGHHCTQPLMERFDLAATARASLYFYNTLEEVDRMVSAMEECHSFFN